MKHSMMRVAVAATLGLSALAANAGQIGVNVGATLAAESITPAVAVAQPTITYQTASLINDGAAVTVHVRFSAGSTSAAGAALPVAATDIKLFLNGAAYAGAYTISAVTADNDGLGYYFTLTAGAGSGGIPAGVVINMTGATAKIASLTSSLGAGTAVTTTVGYTTQAGDFSGVTSFVEPVSTATLLTSAKALGQVVVNSNAVAAGYYAAAEAGQVNVNTTLTSFAGATPTSAVTTGNLKINLGATKLTLNTGLKSAATGVAIAAADLGTTVFSASGDFSVAGATVALTSDAACTTVVAAGTVATGGKSATFAAVAPAVAMAPVYLCYTVPGTKTVPYNVQYAIGGASVNAGPNSIASTQTGANTYLLKSNGASVNVPAFVTQTGALGVGYNTYLRIINTGNLTTAISGAAINSTTGAPGTAATLVSSLAPGASAMVDTTTVTNALGLSAASWNSLVVTGSTSALAVQPLLVNPQGVITNLSAVNGVNNGAAAN